MEKITKLLPGDKAMIRHIMGNVHVGTSDEEVLEFVKERINISKISPRCLREIEEYAIKCHRNNQNLCSHYRF